METLKNNVVSDYISQQVSVHTLAAKYHIGAIKVRQILNEANVERRKRGGQLKNKKFLIQDYNTPKYIPRDGYQYVCRPKDGGNFQTTDTLNKSGCITSYIAKHFGVAIPSLKERHEYYQTTGNYWWEQYFDCTEEKIEKRKTIRCPLCGWETFDIANASGSFTIHLRDKHHLTVEEYLKGHPYDKDCFPKYAREMKRKELLDNEENYVICPLCGEKLRSLTYSHLRYHHNMGMKEFKKLYPDFNVLSDTMREEVAMSQKLSNIAPRKKSSYISKQEMMIREFLDKHGIKYESNRQILEGKEIDILIPSKHIGIEVDGLKWHSEFWGGKKSNYHLDKTELAKRHGYDLIHIFEDEIVMHKEIVLDKLSHILGLHGNLEKVYARKMQVAEISSDKANEILSTYHIQGATQSKVYLGGFYNGELVGVMSFKNGYLNSDGWHVTRYAAKTDKLYIGLAGKLFQHFVRKYKPNKVTSFCDRRWTTDAESALYAKLGFKFVGALEPTYYYYNSAKGRYKRLHPLIFHKKKIMEEHNFDSSLTLSEMLKKLGYDRIWNCGMFKYVWTNDSEPDKKRENFHKQEIA